MILGLIWVIIFCMNWPVDSYCLSWECQIHFTNLKIVCMLNYVVNALPNT